MKQISFLVLLFSITCSIWAQTEENLFEWQDGHNIVVKDKFLELHSDWEQGDTPAYLYKEYDVFSNRKAPYRIQIIGIGNEKMPESGSYELFAIYHNGKKILEHQADNFFCEIGDITADACKDHLFTQVPLSDDSFALLFGNCILGDGTPPEMVVAVVAGDTAKVVYDGCAYAYKYTPGENFAIEYVKETDEFPITESVLKKLTKHKIWKKGNMLKYKSWK